MRALSCRGPPVQIRSHALLSRDRTGAGSVRGRDLNPGRLRLPMVQIRSHALNGSRRAQRIGWSEGVGLDSSPTGRAQRSEHIRVRFKSGPTHVLSRALSRAAGLQTGFEPWKTSEVSLHPVQIRSRTLHPRALSRVSAGARRRHPRNVPPGAIRSGDGTAWRRRRASRGAERTSLTPHRRNLCRSGWGERQRLRPTPMFLR